MKATNGRKEFILANNSKAQHNIEMKSQQPQQEEAGDAASSIEEKGEEYWCSAHFLFLYLLGHLLIASDYPYLGWIFPPQ